MLIIIIVTFHLLTQIRMSITNCDKLPIQCIQLNVWKLIDNTIGIGIVLQAGYLTNQMCDPQFAIL